MGFPKRNFSSFYFYFFLLFFESFSFPNRKKSIVKKTKRQLMKNRCLFSLSKLLRNHHTRLSHFSSFKMIHFQVRKSSLFIVYIYYSIINIFIGPFFSCIHKAMYFAIIFHSRTYTPLKELSTVFSLTMSVLFFCFFFPVPSPS